MGVKNTKSLILRKIMQLECTNFTILLHRLVGNNNSAAYAFLLSHHASSTPERSKEGAKIKLKWGQKHKIHNIEADNGGIPSG